jgi:hypothetical protein
MTPDDWAFIAVITLAMALVCAMFAAAANDHRKDRKDRRASRTQRERLQRWRWPEGPR